MKRFLPSTLLSVLAALAFFGCGRTDLEFSGASGRDGGVGGAGRDGGRDGGLDAGLDAVAGRGNGGNGGSDGSGGSVGNGGSGGRAGTGGHVGTGGVVGTGGRLATGGAIATGGRTGTGGRPGTGGGLGSGGRLGTGGGTGTGGRSATGGTGGVVDGGVRDAAPDRSPADAGPDLPPPTPGALQCGNQICNTSTQSCCVSIAVGSVGAGCIPIGMSCGGAALDCDEPADCAAGVCCFGLQPGGGGGVAIGSRCVARATCNGVGRFLVCRTNADCRAATPVCCNSLGVPICQASCPG